MKTIYIIFNDREKETTWRNLYEDLRMVFEDFIKVKICFLSETRPGDISDGDLFLVLYKERVHLMKEYISSLDKVMVLTRTFARQYLDEVYAIPAGTDVLVVNDSDESTIQTTNSLYELGLNHLNLIPYIPSEGPEKYSHIHMAITPDEEDSVPSFINHIINVHDRCIDTNTFITIINKLNLNSSQITANMLAYIQRTTGDIGRHYITESLTNELLKKNLQELKDSIIITDSSFTMVYFNDKADITFTLSENSHISLELLFESVFSELFPPEDYENKLIPFLGTNYIVTKSTVRIGGQIVGYSLRFSTEADIKNMESDLNKQLMKKGLVAKYRFDDILCKSEVMKKSMALARKVALTDYTILINGESGTGKELLAQSIHNFSARKDRPFVAINCAALPPSLLESELFGYEKGAFTGASPQGKIGLFEQANHGTIFLDEIGDMSLHLQARLLRVLQEKQVTRLGSDRVINLDIRVLAATNRDLAQAIQKNKFREDLYYRLCNIPIKLPALRERNDDVIYIFRSFIGDKYDRLTESEIQMLKTYSWPGNIRELKNAADYYLTLGELPQTILSKFLEETPSAAAGNHPVQTSVQTSAPVSAHGRVPSAAGRTAATAGMQDVEAEVLAIIAENTTDSSGIGRVPILYQLESRGIRISDDKLRKLLKKLEEAGRITVGRGRTGCRIADFDK